MRIHLLAESTLFLLDKADVSHIDTRIGSDFAGKYGGCHFLSSALFSEFSAVLEVSSRFLVSIYANNASLIVWVVVYVVYVCCLCELEGFLRKSDGLYITPSGWDKSKQ